MTDAETTTLTLEAATGAAGPHAIEAFALLGNETRLAILLTLWEAYDPHADDNAVPFSKIFERVDYDDPGSFSYHLKQLEGHFIRKHADEGYVLRVPGRKFIQVVLAGAGEQNAQMETAEINQSCPFCGAPTTIQYREGFVIQVCTDCDGVSTEEDIPGFLSAVPFDPAGLADRTADEIRAASRIAAWRQMQIMFDRLCPACSGPVDGWLDCCPNHESAGICEYCGTKFAVWARFECRICKNHNTSSPKALALFHPAMAAFYDSHGVSTRIRADDFESVRHVFNLMDTHELTLTSEEPPRAEVTARVADEKIRLTFDETASVIDVSQ